MDEYFDGFNRHQRAIDAITRGLENPTEGFDRHQRAIDAITRGLENPTEGFDRHQKAIDAITRGLKNPAEGFDRHQRAIDAITRGLKNPAEGFNRHQRAIDAITRGLKNPAEGFNRYQRAIDAITRGLENPTEGFDRHQRAIDAITRGLENPAEGFHRHQEAIQQIMSSLENTIKVQSFDFNGSLLAMNDVLIDTRTDIETKEKSNPTEIEQELLTWSHEQIEIFYELINSLRNMCNVIDSKIAGRYIWDVLNKIATIITIVNCMQVNEPEIHIHNYYEDVIIESETDGNKTDIYIEKKESPLELQIENGDERYSGGERT